MLLRPLILDHFWLKLISLVLASLIWLTVKSSLGTSGDESRLTFNNRPIMLMTDGGEQVAMVARPNVANITVRGPAALIEELTEKDIHVYVRLPAGLQGASELPVHAHVPSGTKVAMVAPVVVSVKPIGAP